MIPGTEISVLFIEYFVDTFLDGSQSDGEWENQRLKLWLSVDKLRGYAAAWGFALYG